VRGFYLENGINMKISDIDFGKIDAKNELLGGSEAKKERFIKNYILPKNLSNKIPKKFIDEENFIIYGLKGIGKTALLHYLAIHSEKKGAEHDFFLFKSKFSDEEKQEFSQAARVNLIDDNADELGGASYLNVWKWFIYKKIAEKIKSTPNSAIRSNNAADAFIKLTESVKNQEGNDTFRWSKLLPKIKNGNVTISYDPSISLDFEWENNESITKFSNVVKAIESHVEKLSPSTNRYFLFFDELEINVSNKKKTKRDILLIKDLILASYAVNTKLLELDLPIKIIIAIRSEVLRHVESIGDEINKLIEDFGTQIRWEIGADDNLEHPLAQIIIARIKTSLPDIAKTNTDEEIWHQFFYKLIEGEESAKYILHQTWYKPRDIVRLTSTIQEESPDAKIIGSTEIRKARKTYSQKCWTELSEELSTRYNTEEISLIEALLMSAQREFHTQDFISEIEKISAERKIAETYKNPQKAKELLSTLYTLGIIGNTNNSIRRYSFRGDKNPDFGMKFVVHQALYRAFL
jgi:hypothetical protein